MSDHSPSQSLFLALPITTNLGEDGLFRPDRRRFYAGVIAALENCGFPVSCAPTNEDWGRIKLPVLEFTRFDVEAIQAAAGLVVVASERLSRDIYLEVGVAVGARRPVVVYLPRATPVTYMVQGLEALGRLSVFRYDGEDEVPKLVERTLNHALSRTRSDP